MFRELLEIMVLIFIKVIATNHFILFIIAIIKVLIIIVIITTIKAKRKVIFLSNPIL